tara:strand:- start:42 stop:992 length:951 start_codon:yes stop_codon:yes gene_type:complete
MFGQGLNFGGLTGGSAGFDVNYLLVAGGGGGGAWGGGGGAGGYLTNYLGTAISLSVGVPYTVTVGIGGTEATNPGNAGRIIGTNGGDSILSGTGLTTITATGGGAGGTAFATPSQALPGGSGGGADSDRAVTTGGSGNTPATTPSQGNAGGNSGTTSSNYPGGGGGGGAGFAGGSSTGTPPYTPGNGGNGLLNNIDGLGLTYAGGGGGFYYGVGGSRSTGGTGGGGGGGQFDLGAADGGAGTNGLGGGGGSGAAYTGAPYTSASGPGGSGIVTLRYLTSKVSSFAVTGTLNTPTPIILGTDSVLKFTTGTGTVTFS